MDDPSLLLAPGYRLREFIDLGGPVLVVILVLVGFMWTLILERVYHLRIVYRRTRRRVLAQWQGRSERRSWHAHQIRRRWISVVSAELGRHLGLIRVCVLLCPLLGLLGTVTGMVEVFDVLAVSGSGNPRAMAGGIARATVPTMAGMVAALSGIVMHVYLQRRVRRERMLLAEQMVTG